MSFFEDVVDFFENPPWWVAVIAAIFTLGGVGGLSGLLTTGGLFGGGPLILGAQEFIRSVPGLIQGKSFWAAWVGQWMSRVLAGARILGAQFADENIAKPTEQLTKNPQWIDQTKKKWNELRARGLSVEDAGREILAESVRQCRDAGLPAQECRPDVHAMGINYAINENVFDVMDWDLETGSPDLRETWDRIKRSETIKSYTAADLQKIIQEAEANRLPQEIINGLKIRHMDLVRYEEIMSNWGGEPQQRYATKLPVIDEELKKADAAKAQSDYRRPGYLTVGIDSRRTIGMYGRGGLLDTMNRKHPRTIFGTAATIAAVGLLASPLWLPRVRRMG